MVILNSNCRQSKYAEPNSVCFGRDSNERFSSFQQKVDELRQQRQRLKKLEDLATELERRLILDNRYTEYSALNLAQAYDQLDQLGMRMQHNLEQQLAAMKHSGVSEDQVREFSMMFKHFDKEKCGRLNHQDFKSCLRALGYDLPTVDDNQRDEQFESILDIVDPARFVRSSDCLVGEKNRAACLVAELVRWVYRST